MTKPRDKTDRIAALGPVYFGGHIKPMGFWEGLAAAAREDLAITLRRLAQRVEPKRKWRQRQAMTLDGYVLPRDVAEQIDSVKIAYTYRPPTASYAIRRGPDVVPEVQQG